MKLQLFSVCCVAAAITCSSPAFATLGENIDSVQADQVQMKATSRIAKTAASYTVHEIQDVSGTSVREYVSANGTVFGVAWNGPVMPNLRQLLGQYFATYTNASEAKRSSRTHLTVEQPGLVVRSGGHMRAFRGSAFVPSLLPQGVTANEIL